MPRTYMKYIIVKEWTEGPNKGKQWKEISPHKLTVGRCYQYELETRFRVVDIKMYKEEVAVFNYQQLVGIA